MSDKEQKSKQFKTVGDGKLKSGYLFLPKSLEALTLSNKRDTPRFSLIIFPHASLFDIASRLSSPPRKAQAVRCPLLLARVLRRPAVPLFLLLLFLRLL
jgi:hypothetical protein